MARQNLLWIAFNRGLVSRLGLARSDIKRIAMSAETFMNYMPRVLGSMMIRPGLGYKGSTYADAAARILPFIFSSSDKAKLELTANILRVWISNALITRPSVTSAVANGTFDTNLNSWTDNDEAGATSAWVTGGYMGLTGDGTNSAIRDQVVTVSGGNIGVEHALHIIVERGPVILRVGTAAGLDDYITQTSLDTGVHSLALTPTGNFNIRFQSALLRLTLVDECVIESAGVMTVETPWGSSNLGKIRGDQSGDIIFAACEGLQQWKIERRASRSWSVVQYETEDGPFMVPNITPITLTASVISGNGTLTASKALFKTTNIGSLYSLTSTGQTVSASISAQNTFTDGMEVTGTGTDRTFTINISGTWTTTVTLQRSLDSDAGPWSDVSGKTWAANTTETYADGLSNQQAWYRIGIKTGDYGAGTAVVSLNINTGSIQGVVRITAFTSSTVCDMEVLNALGATTATDDWREGQWSDRRGWPTAGVFAEGRLWWTGKNGIWGSVSDGFYSFDDDTTGDSAPINRTIGRGPVDVINWILSLLRLVLGGQGGEFSIKSSSLDEPLTVTNFNVKPASTQGSAAVQAVQIDATGIYVQRGGTRVYELSLDGQTYDYGSTHLSALVPRIGRPGIVRMAVQRQPDTRVHFVRSDGTVAVLVFDKVENVNCWIEVETDGLIEDVCVLPGGSGDEEDEVTYVVARTINGSTKRYVEVWATEDECRGLDDNDDPTTCYLADSFIHSTGVSRTVITGLDSLEGEQVVVWADGADVGYDSDENLIYTVSGGQITLAVAAVDVIVGLPYTAQWQSGKLVQLQAQMGTPLTKAKRIPRLGLIAADLHPKGLKYGPTFARMDPMPEVEQGETIDPDTIRVNYDEESFEFPGEWGPDSRLCLESKAPRPATILALVAETEMHGG